MSSKIVKGLLVTAVMLATGMDIPQADAAVFVQCPGDTNGDAVPDGAYDPNALQCMHLTAGDGFISMADGKLQYMFGFSDVTGLTEDQIMTTGTLAANFPAPTIVLKQGQEFYLSLTNVGMAIRPDLFDPHTVHFHGFPNASSVFDGVPDASISINGGSTLTYYYNLVEPGTYMYHCHVEATEHMQMGMLGNLYVLPAQNNLPAGTDLNGFTHQAGYQYVYNDGDGSTRYDVEVPIQIGSFDPVFHDASMNVQPLPFAEMKDRYPMLNGRGYPDTVDPLPLTPPAESGSPAPQPVSSLVSANVGDKVLLRISNLNVTNFYTLATNGLKMHVVGTGARLLRGPDGKDTAYDTNSITLGGGESVDVIIDTAGVSPGTYFLYTTNLNFLSNDGEDFGGMMTEIRIN
jgi:FtsP/CotA-like multicopper oxidase with cupredoxin domain